jgi:starch synthase
MTPLKILFATAEAAPFAKTGGLADVSAAPPRALTALGHDVRVVLPLYPRVREQAPGLVPLDGSKLVLVTRAGVRVRNPAREVPGTDLDAWFVDCPPCSGAPRSTPRTATSTCASRS